jgi:hypothetical protein
MNEIQSRTIHHARKAILVARARCLPPGYYPDTMATRLEESNSLLGLAMVAAKMAAACLAGERKHAELADFLRKVSNNSLLLLSLSPEELQERFGMVLEPPKEPQKGTAEEPQQPDVDVHD